MTENVGKWFLLHLIPKDSKVATLCCCDRFLFCLVSYKRSRWNFLLFSEIIVIHTKGAVQTGMDTTKTVLTGTKDTVSTGLTGAMGVAKGAVQTGIDTRHARFPRGEHRGSRHRFL